MKRINEQHPIATIAETIAAIVIAVIIVICVSIVLTGCVPYDFEMNACGLDAQESEIQRLEKKLAATVELKEEKVREMIETERLLEVAYKEYKEQRKQFTLQCSKVNEDEIMSWSPHILKWANRLDTGETK